MRVIAEGVDTEDKLEQLVRLGCRYAQGYHLAMPMDFGACTDWLRERAGTLALAD
jgi:EAL domain-containing protein (putative c-di-GMP-specific phosphodiesterase class I)